MQQMTTPEDSIGVLAYDRADAINQSPSIPSNNQLLDRLPSVAAYPPLFRSRPNLSMHNFPGFGDAAAARVLRIDRQSLPATADIRHLVDHFFAYTNSAYPILHRPTFERQLAEVVQASDVRGSASDICAVLLVLAVSATSLPRQRSAAQPSRYIAMDLWRQAAQYIEAATSLRGLPKLQIRHLQLQFVLYNPDCGDVWELAGAAMRLAVDLGLHHELSPAALARTSPLVLDMRRRLFWISFSIDRNLAVALGRPPGIPDDWITTEFPSDVSDAYITHDGIIRLEPSPTKTSARHLFRIRCLQANIQNRLYRQSESPPPPPSWFANLNDQLDAWRSTYPTPTPTGFVSSEWLDLNYHLTLALLFRPSPGNPTPDREAVTKAFKSSAAAMRVYKEMHRKGRINYSESLPLWKRLAVLTLDWLADWLAMYHLFICGLTYLNSLLEAQKGGWTIVPSLVEALLDMQGCSLVMEALAAITIGTAGIRDALESVSEGVIRHLGLNSRMSRNSRASSPNQEQLAPARQSIPGSMLDLNLSSGQMQPANIASASTANNPQLSLPANDTLLGQPASAYSGFEALMQDVNPLDELLFFPPGDRTELEWDEAVASALRQLQSGSDWVES